MVIRSNFLNAFYILIFGITFFSITTADKVEDVFKQHEVVPDVIAAAPNQFLKVTYQNGLLADKGAELTPTQVKAPPKVEWEAEANAYYTLIMTDPDAPSRAEPMIREFHHWLVANIPGNALDQGETITGYIGAGPPKDTGLHRYVFLLYKQPGQLEFDEKRVGSDSITNRPKFSAAEFAKKHNLGSPVAGNFFQAQWDDYVPVLHQQLSG